MLFGISVLNLNKKRAVEKPLFLIMLLLGRANRPALRYLFSEHHLRALSKASNQGETSSLRSAG